MTIEITVPRERLTEFLDSIVPLLGKRQRVAVASDPDSMLVQVRGGDVENIREKAQALGLQFEVIDLGQPFRLLASGDALLEPTVDALLDQNVILDAVEVSFDGPDGPPLADDDGDPRQPPVEVLDCESREVFKTDAVEQPVRSGDGSFTNEGAKKLAATLARKRAIRDAREALKKVDKRCELPCTLKSETILGAPTFVERTLETIGVFGYSIIYKTLVVARVPWQIEIVCSRAPIQQPEEGEDTADKNSPVSCDGAYTVGGKERGKATKIVAYNVPLELKKERRRLIEEARQLALDKIEKLLDAALDDLPNCPQVTCPTPTLTITYGLSEKVRFLSDGFTFDGGPGATTSGWTAIVDIPWQFKLTCN